MASNWPTHKVMALQERGVLLVEDGNHGEYRPRTEEFGSGDYAFIRAADMDGGRILFSSAERVNAAAIARIRKGIGKGGDVLFSHKGTVGKLAFAPLDAPLFVCSPQTTFWRTLDESVLDRRFLYFYMHASEFTDQWYARKGETDMADYVSLTAQRELSIAVPPLPEQRAIAAVLGALDDKIEVNRKTARVLEGIARAVFTSWFVDFDPVRYNMQRRGEEQAYERMGRAARFGSFGEDISIIEPDGRSRPLRPEDIHRPIAHLFPDRFVDSPMGEIPEGWRVGTLGEVIEAVGGGTPSTGEPTYWEGGTHAFCTPKDMSALSAPVLLRTERRVTDAGLAKINSGLLPRGTVVMSSRAPIGYLAITEIPVAVNQGIIAMKCESGWPASFVVRWCEAHMDRIEANANGSTFQEISKRNFRTIAAVLPDPAVVAAFDRVAGPLHRRVVACERQSATLAALRDTLLPKLISGELRIADADKIVGRLV